MGEIPAQGPVVSGGPVVLCSEVLIEFVCGTG